MVFGPGSFSTVTDGLILPFLRVPGPLPGDSGGVERRRVDLEPLPSHLGWLGWLEAQVRELCHLNQGDPW